MANVIKIKICTSLISQGFYFCSRLKPKIFFYLLLSLALEIKAQQVINIESKQYDSRDSGWHGTIDFSFNLIQNSNQVISTGNKVNLIQVQSINTILFINEFNFVRANTQNLDYNSYQHLRFKRYIKPYLSGEVFGQTQFNQQIGLKFRGLLGAGPRFRLFYADSMKIFVGPMWMYEYEQTTDESLKNVKNRLSLYFSFLYFKEKHFNFDFVSYYQPDLIDFSDFRLSSELKAEWLITKKLSFKFSLSQTYNSHPAANNPNHIMNVRNTFSYRF